MAQENNHKLKRKKNQCPAPCHLGFLLRNVERGTEFIFQEVNTLVNDISLRWRVLRRLPRVSQPSLCHQGSAILTLRRHWIPSWSQSLRLMFLSGDGANKDFVVLRFS